MCSILSLNRHNMFFLIAKLLRYVLFCHQTVICSLLSNIITSSFYHQNIICSQQTVIWFVYNNFIVICSLLSTSHHIFLSVINKPLHMLYFVTKLLKYVLFCQQTIINCFILSSNYHFMLAFVNKLTYDLCCQHAITICSPLSTNHHNMFSFINKPPQYVLLYQQTITICSYLPTNHHNMFLFTNKPSQ